MKVIAEVPHKILFSGSYTILDGCPALALAVGPRLTLKLVAEAEVTWPTHNAFAQAVRDEIKAWLQEHRSELELEALAWGDFRSHITMPIEGWGVGSSASFTTALVLAQMTAFGIPLTPMELFALARRAHRRAQGGKGSGIDVAACSYGEVVRVSNAAGDETPTLERLCWPLHTGVLLFRSGKKADTRQAITTYFGTSPQRRRQLSRPLMRAVGQVCRTLLHDDQSMIPALRENAQQEKAWSEATGIPLVTPLQLELEEALKPLIDRDWVAIKSLGAGGGDSIGCFYRNDQVSLADIVDQLQETPLQSRPASIERTGAYLHCPPSPFPHAPDLGSPCEGRDPSFHETSDLFAPRAPRNRELTAHDMKPER